MSAKYIDSGKLEFITRNDIRSLKPCSVPLILLRHIYRYHIHVGLYPFI